MKPYPVEGGKGVAETGASFFLNLNTYVFNRKMSVWAAAEKGDLDGVKAAVENGADIEERGGRLKGTALHHACSMGYFSITEYLIQRGAEVNSRDKDDSLPIHDACRRGNLDTVKFLINKGSDFTSTNKFGRTPLHVASLNGHAPLVEYLIQRGAEVNSRDEDRFLPTHGACMKGHLDTVQLLTSTNDHGNTPLHLASFFGHRPVVDHIKRHTSAAAGN